MTLHENLKSLGAVATAYRYDQPDAALLESFPSPFAPVSAQPESTDRTGRLTIHPELLDADGSLTQEDLLTVRFSDGAEETVLPPETP